MMDDDDGRTSDHGHPISSPCEPNGSGELKNLLFGNHKAQSFPILCVAMYSGPL